MCNRVIACLPIIAAAFLSNSPAEEPLPLKEERLGAWHYLYPMDYYGGGAARNSRYVYPPTAVAFSGKVAAFVPGSNILASFDSGRFEDLKLPDSFTPVSLAVDGKGTLYCLLAKQPVFIKDRQAAQARWFTAYRDSKWSEPLEIPFSGCDRICFDSQNRLWVLGPSRTVAVRSNEAWDSYTYSNDQHLAFMPIRMAEHANGDVALFSYSEGAYEQSRMPGALLYRNGRFIREPKTDVTAWCQQEKRRQSAIHDDRAYDRSSGYVCHKVALNSAPHQPATVLRANNLVLVSFGNDGLAWTTIADLAAQPPLSDTAEWEPVNDVTVPPTLDSSGNLWLGRDNPSRLITFSKDKIFEIAADIQPHRENTIDFDQLGRPWVACWHGSSGGEMTVGSGGSGGSGGAGGSGDSMRLKRYVNYHEALKAEAAAFKPGRILPWAVKTPKGVIGSGGGFFGEFVILDSHGLHIFEAAAINPEERQAEAGASHGYNPFQDCIPWYDKQGRIYAKVLGAPFCYTDGSWMAAGNKPESDSVVADPPPRDTNSREAGAFQSAIQTADGRVFIFGGFHFHEKKGADLTAVETGLNPLAFYPFWTNWYSAPGQTKPVIDPDGRIWISPLGPYADNRKWFVLRKPGPAKPPRLEP